MQTLNTKLFNVADEKLRLHTDVRNKLIDIANAFLGDLREQSVNIYPADIRLVGSNAGFDYTQYSDIDLHLVMDFSLYADDMSLIQSTLNIFRMKFNGQYDITVKGINVELYAEDIHSGTVSNGIYSILQNRWIKFPQEEPCLEELITDDIKQRAQLWVELIQKALDSDANDISKASYYLEECEHLLNRLYMMRKNGLEVSGRLSEGNLIFKTVRNSGMLDALKRKRDEFKSASLTLESLKRR